MQIRILYLNNTGSIVCIECILGHSEASCSFSDIIKVNDWFCLEILTEYYFSLAVIYIQSDATRQDQQSGLK